MPNNLSSACAGLYTKYEQSVRGMCELTQNASLFRIEGLLGSSKKRRRMLIWGVGVSKQG